ncbi:hypothetical protein ACQKM2_38425 [Streptomyces sp. NPDC004126]|uniref:hypothetical protein n=1 Tax=Streptomyces sp. NPDC004126 TaxID=3390695 RepID=UPI003D036707
MSGLAPDLEFIAEGMIRGSVRTNFAFYPPQDDGGAWRATAELLERALREAFPEPTADHRISGIHGVPVLDFEIESAPGVWIDGTAPMPKPDYAYITLTDVTAGGRRHRGGAAQAPRLRSGPMRQSADNSQEIRERYVARFAGRGAV